LKVGSRSAAARSIDDSMVPPPPSTLEGSVLPLPHALHVPAAVRADRLWHPRLPLQAWRYPLLRRMLAWADVVAAASACLAAGLAGAGDVGQSIWSFAFLPFWVGLAKVLGLYDRDERQLRHTTIDEALYVLLWALIGASLLALLLSLTSAGGPAASSTLVAASVAAATLFPLRALARFLWRRVTPPERVAIVGSAAAAGVLKRKLELFPHVHVTIVEEREGLEYEENRAAELLRSVDRLVYAPTSLDDEEVRRLLDLAHATRSLVTVVPPCRDVLSPAVRVNHLADLPVLEYRAPDVSRSTAFLKRALDVLVSVTALLVLLPLCLLIGFAIKLDSRGPVLFAQTRAGTGGRPFRMLKFRSMVADAEEQLHNLVALDRLPEPVFKLHGDPRVTRLGRTLRRWSLDELPQLWNVLVGEMSLVGPRPEQLELVEHYEPEHLRRLEVKPGMTGPMQVYGRGELNFAERLVVERDYIENMSIFGDLRILALTIPAALSGRGAY
jgi:exopolysaccharide biosynthesis polyprenyl glycosylphosphotransferase